MNNRLGQKVNARMEREELQGPQYSAVRVWEVKELGTELKAEGVSLWQPLEVQEAVHKETDGEDEAMGEGAEQGGFRF